MTQITTEEITELLENGEKLYAPIEVAYVLNLQTATIQDYCRSGKISAIKVGSQWRIQGKEIARYISSGPRDQETKDAY